MKSFLTVFKFELFMLIRKKSFVISTIFIIVIAFLTLSIPRYSTMFDKLIKSNDTAKTIMIYDENHILTDQNIVKTSFKNDNVKYVDSIDTIKKAVKEEKAEAGFVVNSETTFTYYIENSSITDTNKKNFESLLSKQYQATQLQKKGYDINEINKIYHAPIVANSIVLGTDGANHYFYTYALIFLLFFMIIMYGNQIGIGVASEKSNRAIEILTTSCSPNALIFGKVMAGAVTGIFQTACILGSVAIAYKLNADGWNHALDPYFNIPTSVIVTFAFFGIFGYLLYSFLYGAIGALVSKIEEVNGATLPIQMFIMASYFLAFLTISMPDSLLARIASFVPFTSPICMFVSFSMGSSSLVEVVISLALLIIMTGLMGMIGAKLYRRGTMSYGNSAKFKTMLKIMVN